MKTLNFQLKDTALDQHFKHIIENPGNPLYNSFIIHGDTFAGTLALLQLKENLESKYPDKEVLYYTSSRLNDFIKSIPKLLIENYHKLHPNLIGVLVEELSVRGLDKKAQDNLALFLKKLVSRNIQVVVSTNIVPYKYGINTTFLTGEMYSWYLSGREYMLKGKAIYTKDLSKARTLEQDKKDKPDSLGKTHRIGQIYPGILIQNPPHNIDPKMNLMPKAKCPACGKTELMPYNFVRSMISGNHIVWFYCKNCKERLATNQVSDYFAAVNHYYYKVK